MRLMLTQNQQKVFDYLKQKIVDCKSMFADPPVTEITTKTVIKKKQKSEENENLGG